MIDEYHIGVVTHLSTR